MERHAGSRYSVDPWLEENLSISASPNFRAPGQWSPPTFISGSWSRPRREQTRPSVAGARPAWARCCPSRANAAANGRFVEFEGAGVDVGAGSIERPRPVVSLGRRCAELLPSQSSRGGSSPDQQRSGQHGRPGTQLVRHGARRRWDRSRDKREASHCAGRSCCRETRQGGFTS